jgi:hypothetical protein
VFGAKGLLDSIADDSADWEAGDWEATLEILESVQLDIHDTLAELALLRSGMVRQKYRDYAHVAVGAVAQLQGLRTALATAVRHAKTQDAAVFEDTKKELGAAYAALTTAMHFDPRAAGDAEAAIKQQLLQKVDSDRDMAMAEALHASKDVPGVWKVGQSHLSGVWDAIDAHEPGWVATHHKILDEDLFTQVFDHWYKATDATAYAAYIEERNAFRQEGEDMEEG